MKITVEEWAKRTYLGIEISSWVLGKWRRNGQIYPPPERVGRQWFVPENAVRVVGDALPNLADKLRETA